MNVFFKRVTVLAGLATSVAFGCGITLPEITGSGDPGSSSSGGNGSISGGSTSGSTTSGGSTSGTLGTTSSSGAPKDAGKDVVADAVSSTSSSGGSTSSTSSGCVPTGNPCGTKCSGTESDGCGTQIACGFTCSPDDVCGASTRECCRPDETGAGKCGSVMDLKCGVPIQGKDTCNLPNQMCVGNLCTCNKPAIDVACAGKCDGSNVPDGCGGSLTCSAGVAGACKFPMICDLGPKMCCMPKAPPGLLFCEPFDPGCGLAVIPATKICDAGEKCCTNRGGGSCIPSNALCQ
jgi:hypothetical protein